MNSDGIEPRADDFARLTSFKFTAPDDMPADFARPQFSVRSLLIAMTVVALALGAFGAIGYALDGVKFGIERRGC